MPLQVISQLDAQNSRRFNRHRKWGHGTKDVQSDRAELASNRIGQDFFAAAVKAPFKMARTDGTYTVGSCFAREVEEVFLRSRVTVLSRHESLANDPAFCRAEDGRPETGFYSRFNTPSMALEFERAFDRVPFREDHDLLLETAPGLFEDNHYSRHFGPSPLDVCVHRRRTMRNLVQNVTRARVVFLTLGLNECWFDRDSGFYMNTTPKHGRSTTVSHYECHVLTVSENVDALERIHAILTDVIPGEFEMVVTVSPVPFEATFTSDDVVIANSASKSVLRASASEFCVRHSNVHYFPSYEMAVYSDRPKAWYRDQIHVSPGMVRHITSTFMNEFMDD